MRTHQLKTDPIPFDAVWTRRKHFEIRYNDRGYKVGDVLELVETKYSSEQMKKEKKPLIYTGRQQKVVVTHIMYGPEYGLADEWCIMSIEV